jgi:hypothetical protein
MRRDGDRQQVDAAGAGYALARLDRGGGVDDVGLRRRGVGALGAMTEESILVGMLVLSALVFVVSAVLAL